MRVHIYVQARRKNFVSCCAKIRLRHKLECLGPRSLFWGLVVLFHSALSDTCITNKITIENNCIWELYEISRGNNGAKRKIYFVYKNK